MRAGVTAKFNLNLLRASTASSAATSTSTSFCHQAFYNRRAPAASRCISPAASARRSRVAGRTIEFRAGETIHTENSYKYTVEVFRRAGARLRLDADRDLDRRRRLFLGARADDAGVLISRVRHRRRSSARRRQVQTPDRVELANVRCRSAKPIPGACNISSTSPVRPTSTSRPRTRDAWLWYPRASLGLRQDRGRAEPGPRRRAARRDAAALSGVLQADHQSQGHGRRQPRARAPRPTTTTALTARPHVDDAARRPPRQLRRRGGRRRAALVAPRHRRAGRRGHVRLLDRARRAPMPAIEDYCGAWIRRHLAGYTGMLNLETIGGRIIEVHLRFERPVARSLRRGLGRGAGAALSRSGAGTSPTRPPRRLQRRAVRPARAALSPSAAGAGRRGAQHAGRVERADHLPRGQGPRAARHAAGRLPARDRQRLEPRRPASPAASCCGRISSPGGVDA